MIRAGSQYGSSALLKAFVDRMKITKTFSSQPISAVTSINDAIIFKLKKGTYIDGIRLSTKDGKSIADNVSAVFHSDEQIKDDIAIMPGICSN